MEAIKFALTVMGIAHLALAQEADDRFYYLHIMGVTDPAAIDTMLAGIDSNLVIYRTKHLISDNVDLVIRNNGSADFQSIVLPEGAMVTVNSVMSAHTWFSQFGVTKNWRKDPVALSNENLRIVRHQVDLAGINYDQLKAIMFYAGEMLYEMHDVVASPIFFDADAPFAFTYYINANNMETRAKINKFLHVLGNFGRHTDFLKPSYTI